MSIWTNIKKRGLTDITNPKRIWAYIKSLFTTDIKEKQAFTEQVIYRQSFPECRVCLSLGECIHCGCKTPDLFHDRKMVCSGGNWSEMISAEEWQEKKKEEGIELGIKYV